MHIDDYNPMHSTDGSNSDIDYRFADFNNNVENVEVGFTCDWKVLNRTNFLAWKRLLITE
jgi:hypothetical protein